MTNLRSLPMINVQTDAPAADLAILPDLTVVADLSLIADPAPSTPASRYVMTLLAGGVPLSLLLDLADPAGPPSADIASSEMDCRSLLGDLMAFRASAAEGAGRGAKARASLRGLRFG